MRTPTLPASNVYFAKAYPVERLECLLGGLAEAFAFFGGVPERVVLDNTSLAVKKVHRGRDREETEAFHAFRGQYPFGVDFCAPAKGNEKGSAETGVKYVRNNVFRPMPEVEDFDELNARIARELLADIDERHLEDGRTVRQAWHAEREHLRPLPAHRPETCRQMSRTADKFGHVKVGRVSYSVPIRFARRAVWENGFNESFNGKLRDELLNGEIFYTLAEARVLIELWRREYNHVRPHSSLGYRPPAPETWRPAEAASATLRRPRLVLLGSAATT